MPKRMCCSAQCHDFMHENPLREWSCMWEPTNDEEIVQVQTVPASSQPCSTIADSCVSASSSEGRTTAQSSRIFSDKLRSLTLSSRQCTQRAVQRLMHHIRGLCEESALGAEDRASINMDSLVSSMWPQAEFEGLEKDFFCKHRYRLVADAEEQAMDALRPDERQILVIILSVKDGICEALHLMGFSELQESHLEDRASTTPTYEWRLRRFRDTGAQHASWLHLDWSMAEVETPIRPAASSPWTNVDVDTHQRKAAAKNQFVVDVDSLRDEACSIPEGVAAVPNRWSRRAGQAPPVAGCRTSATQDRRPCNAPTPLYSISSRTSRSSLCESPRSHISFTA